MSDDGISESKPAKIITKKLGPLPVWAWVVVGSGAVFIAFKIRGKQTGTGTGLPFGSSTAGGSSGGGSGGGGSSGGTGGGSGDVGGSVGGGGSGGGSSGGGSGGATSGSVLAAQQTTDPISRAASGMVSIVRNVAGVIIPSGHVPSVNNKWPSEYPTGIGVYEQLRQDRMAQGFGILSNLGISSGGGAIADPSGKITKDAKLNTVQYESAVASLAGTLDMATQRVGESPTGLSINTGYEETNQAVAKTLVNKGYVSSVYNGQVYAAKDTQTYWKNLNAPAQANLARLLVAIGAK